MVRKLIIAAALAIALALVAAATGSFVATRQPGLPGSPGQTPGEMAATTTTTVLDPGIAACKASARNAARHGADMPTMAQREASWNHYQQSSYKDLRDVGVKFERAWTNGDLAAKFEASMNMILVCAAYGVEVKVKS